ncbi:protein apnoia-like [Scaptodrosophila lebanonensis]|uniref:Protein apnoia-like n=1 Tax=Drosophila lebanonensis TaxID=7225 RepID=A0A6J2T7J2_DROLE|nr:protein apnoia-like [Scaptodrosophila lebanonensis]XP_030371260.1 protein apnoia-like [Scaptodrosophila lebanonensis]
MAIAQKIALALVLLCLVCDVVLCQQTGSNSSSSSSDADVAESRTFGHHFLRRMSFAVVPGAFVVGVITTLLAALTVVSMKGLGVGVILLVLAIGQMLSRALPVQAAAAYVAPPAPVPVVYSHSHTQQPVWLEKEW